MAATTMKDPRTKIDPTGRPTTNTETTARIDTTRCVEAGDSAELEGAAWIAVVGDREEVTSDAARKLAIRYWAPGGAYELAHGPTPDSPTIIAPAAPGEIGHGSVMTDTQSYLARAAAMNLGKKAGNCVSFYLVRRVTG